VRALVTGGAGFIGSNIIRLLTEKGSAVVAYDNLSTGYLKNLTPFPQVDFVEGDVTDLDKLKKAMRGCDTVFHLAASIGNAKSIAFPREDSRINVLGTLNVAEAVRENGVKAVVYSSSAGLFGEPQYLPVDEKHPCEPDSPYGVSKMAGEKHLLCLGRLYRFRAVSLRYFNVYGINQRYDAYGNVIPIFVTKILKGEELTIFDDGEQTRDFVNVRDIAAANVAAAENIDASGTFNLGSGKAVTINYLVNTLQKLVSGKMAVKYGPDRPGDVRHSLADITRARQVLGYTPLQDIAEGLKDYLDWMRREMEARSGE
jgi:UDP-glucose 4-epimerase